jgi:hypothetical protein
MAPRSWIAASRDDDFCAMRSAPRKRFGHDHRQSRVSPTASPLRTGPSSVRANAKFISSTTEEDRAPEDHEAETMDAALERGRRAGERRRDCAEAVACRSPLPADRLPPRSKSRE